MFNSVDYKKNAQRQLKGRYKPLVLITLISLLVIIALCGFSSNSSAMKFSHESTSFDVRYTVNYGLPLPIILACISIVGILIMANAYVYVSIGKGIYNLSFDTFLEGLSYWMKGILAALWSTLWLFLWSLLFVIPAMVRLFSYSQVFFILADNPGVSVRKALRISILMTRGHKSDLFFMILSFIGWIILSLCTLGIGFLWTIPYMAMTACNAYYAMKYEALRSGIITELDLK